MLRTHKIALAPNDRQRSALVQHAGYARYAYNQGLQLFKDGLDGLYGRDPERPEHEGKWFSKYDLAKIFNAIKFDIAPWARELYQDSSEQAIVGDLGKAIERWGRDRANGFPKFRSRHKCMSFRVRDRNLKIEDRRIRLPNGIGWVRMREPLRFDGRVKQARITLDAGRWFACVSVEIEEPPKRRHRPRGVVGIDVGIETLATLSDGTRFENPKALASHQRRLRNLDRAIARSRNTHGKNRRSNRRRRLYRRREELHRKIRDIRRDHIHRATSAIAKCGYTEVKVESLNVKGMMRSARGTVEQPGRKVRRKSGLNRSLGDASLSEFLATLEYKCAAAGIVFTEIDKWFPSSKTCNICGVVRENLALSDRHWTCVCGARHDRDFNAARNIRDYSPDTAAGLNGRGGGRAGRGRAPAGDSPCESSSKRAEAVSLAAPPGQLADAHGQQLSRLRSRFGELQIDQ